MSVSSQKMCYAAVVVFCVMLSTAAVQADRPPHRLPLMDEKCGDLSDGADVSFYLSPVADIPKMGAMKFDKRNALEWFVNFVECAIENCGKEAPSLIDRVKCSKDVEGAWLSNTHPSPSKRCDITDTYLEPFCEAEDNAFRFIIFPPPMYGAPFGLVPMENDCSMSAAGFDGVGSASISTFADNSAAEASANGGRGSRVKLNVVASEGPGFSRASSSASVTSSPSRRPPKQMLKRKAVALTACKGTCCITLVLSGEMYNRLRDLTSGEMCSVFKLHGRSGDRRERFLGL